MILIFFLLCFKLSLIFFAFLLIYILITQLIYLKLKLYHNSVYKSTNIKTISFVHPFCSDCGGGEKVLWRMIKSLINYYDTSKSNREQNLPKLKINIISGRKDDKQILFDKLKSRFGIQLNDQKNILMNKLVLEIELISMESGYMLRPRNFLTKFTQMYIVIRPDYPLLILF